jgi:hypothetical protein
MLARTRNFHPSERVPTVNVNDYRGRSCELKSNLCSPSFHLTAHIFLRDLFCSSFITRAYNTYYAHIHAHIERERERETHYAEKIIK